MSYGGIPLAALASGALALGRKYKPASRLLSSGIVKRPVGQALLSGLSTLGFGGVMRPRPPCERGWIQVPPKDFPSKEIGRFYMRPHCRKRVVRGSRRAARMPIFPVNLPVGTGWGGYLTDVGETTCRPGYKFVPGAWRRGYTRRAYTRGAYCKKPRFIAPLMIGGPEGEAVDIAGNVGRSVRARTMTPQELGLALGWGGIIRV